MRQQTFASDRPYDIKMMIIKQTHYTSGYAHMNAKRAQSISLPALAQHKGQFQFSLPVGCILTNISENIAGVRCLKGEKTNSSAKQSIRFV